MITPTENRTRGSDSRLEAAAPGSEAGASAARLGGFAACLWSFPAVGAQLRNVPPPWGELDVEPARRNQVRWNPELRPLRWS